MKKYVCNIWGYVYNPNKGDSDNNIEPNTPFEKLPNNWVWPLCVVEKHEFSKTD